MRHKQHVYTKKQADEFWNRPDVVGILHQVRNGRISLEEASKTLSVSTRTIAKYYKRGRTKKATTDWSTPKLRQVVADLAAQIAPLNLDEPNDIRQAHEVIQKTAKSLGVSTTAVTYQLYYKTGAPLAYKVRHRDKIVAKVATRDANNHNIVMGDGIAIPYGNDGSWLTVVKTDNGVHQFLGYRVHVTVEGK